MAEATPRLPPSSPNQPVVTISPFTGGRITLPERFFVRPADQTAAKTVPSLAFLIQHPSPPTPLPFLKPSRQSSSPPSTTTPLRLMFDLGLRSSPSRYLPAQQTHLEGRQPHALPPGTAASLRAGGIDPSTPGAIAAVLYSHVHYDHHGDPEDFPHADFVIGHGAWNVLKKGLPGIASHQIFQEDLLDEARTTELSDPNGGGEGIKEMQGGSSGAWKPLGPFPRALDLLGDGSMYLVDSPGHLPGHVNMLARVAADASDPGNDRWVYLAGDTAHDLRLLSGEREIGTWTNEHGREICIHLDKEKAAESIARVRRLREVEGDKVEVVIAHDDEWAARNEARFFPNHL